MSDLIPKQALTDQEKTHIRLARDFMTLHGYNHVVTCDSSFKTSLGKAALEKLQTCFAGQVHISPDPGLVDAKKYLVVGFKQKDDAEVFEGALRRLVAAVPLPGPHR